MEEGSLTTSWSRPMRSIFPMTFSSLFFFMLSPLTVCFFHWFGVQGDAGLAVGIPGVNAQGQTDDAIGHESPEIFAQQGVAEYRLADFRGHDEHGVEEQGADQSLRNGGLAHRSPSHQQRRHREHANLAVGAVDIEG